jgi:hypothetical protein
MIHVVLAYDEKDDELGDYFESCAKEVKEVLSGNEKFQVVPINGKNLNSAFIGFKLDSLKERFIFASFSHGTAESLTYKNSVPYIDVGDSIDIFFESFLYTIACHSGKVLGKKLNAKGCIFWGYNKTTYVLRDFQSASKLCDIFGLISFLKGETIENAYKSALYKYQEEIDKLEEIDPIAASILDANKNAMIRYGGVKERVWDFDSGTS